MANDQVQINLDNDTANFRAQHSALALIQIGRPKNTSRAYERVPKEWRVIFIIIDFFLNFISRLNIRAFVPSINMLTGKVFLRPN